MDVESSRVVGMMFKALALLSAVASGLCATSPPPGSITVGPGGTYSTLSAALQDTSSNVYFVYATSIQERVVITRSNITIYGQTSDESTYSQNQATIYNNIPASTAGSNEASATVSIHASATDVKLYNLNIANTYGRGSQAIALAIDATRFGAYGVNLTGYQDTLLTNNRLHYFSKGYINGATDFIFGMNSSIWITQSTIETTATGWITASGRFLDDPYYYVIDRSNIIGTGTQYLGRPWRDHARVIFQNSVLGSQIQSAGWSGWGTTPTDHVFYGEYNNTGPGAWNSARVAFATNMEKGLTLDTVFGGSIGWVDPAYL
ncbi:pectinesterase [Rhizoctonia solani 123E]|uniref:Pectinesterase n=1 Tax=Rhizoctonia solani 123E TaxID=1423351 RepID=A0A074RRV2_9AGAM|nr:pectinesterase [Rhizoctonia solani 123E]